MTPDATRTYTLTVTGTDGGTATARATVTVYPAPVVVSFAAAADHVLPGGSTSVLAVFDAGPEGSASVTPGESIQAAIDLATPGTTIYLQPGTYAPAAAAEAFLVFRAEKNGVVLRGTGATAAEVVLDGQDRVLHVLFYDEGIDAGVVDLGYHYAP